MKSSLHITLCQTVTLTEVSCKQIKFYCLYNLLFLPHLPHSQHQVHVCCMQTKRLLHSMNSFTRALTGRSQLVAVLRKNGTQLCNLLLFQAQYPHY